LARCTSEEADQRYPTASALALDFRRHLADLPLRGVGNRSLIERWGKWRRRRPFALPLALTAAALILVCVGWLLRANHQIRGAEQALESGERHLAHGQHREAAESFRGGEALIEGIPAQGGLRERLRAGRHDAERGQVAADLHSLCEQVRPFYASEAVAPAQLHRVADQCRAVWEQRETIARQLGTLSESDDHASWRSDLLDLGILTAHLEVQAATAGERDMARRRALETLDQAEALLGRSGVLCLERTRHLRALHRDREADASATQATMLPPGTAWEHLVMGRMALVAGDLPRAAMELNRSLTLDPRSVWANYYKGLCCLRQGQSTEAIAAFSACVALSPDSAWCMHARGLAFLKAGHHQQALADFDRALAIDPQLAIAYRDRAAAYQHLGRMADADADLHRAAELGISLGEY
jgi:tetratricopeptide (TPR) repeat protein